MNRVRTKPVRKTPVRKKPVRKKPYLYERLREMTEQTFTLPEGETLRIRVHGVVHGAAHRFPPPGG